MLGPFRKLFSRKPAQVEALSSAQTAQQDTKPPKTSSKQLVIPRYLGLAKGMPVANSITDITNIDTALDARTAGTLASAIKKLAIVSPDLSAAIATKIATAISSRYTVIAYDEMGRVDPNGTELMQVFTKRLDYASYDYSRFTRPTDFRTVSASLLMDSIRYGSMGYEVILGKMRVPAFFKPFPTNPDNIKWISTGNDTYPQFVSATGLVDLNFPTIIYSVTQQDLESAYPDPPLQAALQVCLWDIEFMNDLRRAASKNLLQRMKVTINSEKYLATLPVDVQSDPVKLEEHMTALVSKLEAQINNLDPQDSLVLFDLMSADIIGDANRSEDRSITVLEDLINGKIATGAKILPSVIGRGASSTAASAESMLFIRGLIAVQNELNIMFSRGLTLVNRLFGNPGYVQFKFEEVNLRPELELASFRAIEQSSILEKLSFGFISDIEASIFLTGTVPPQGFKPLSGTRFETTKPNVSGNDYSNTSVDAGSGKTNSTQAQKNTAPDNKGVKSS